MNETKTRENWTENQEKYIRFLGRGKRDKQGNKYTNEEFAKALGINPDTLYSWKHLPGFMQAVFDQSIREIGDHLPDMNQAMMMKAVGVVPKGRKQASEAAYMALMRQMGLLKADKTENKNENTDTITYQFSG